MSGRQRVRRAVLISDADYARLLEAQGGVCAICGHPPKRVKLNTDHDHGTRKRVVRGLLCHRCNRYLPAWIRPAWLRKAADYLERPPALAVLGDREYDPDPMAPEAT